MAAKISGAGITVGLAQLTAGQILPDVIAEADHDMYTQRADRSSPEVTRSKK